MADVAPGYRVTPIAPRHPSGRPIAHGRTVLFAMLGVVVAIVAVTVLVAKFY